MSALVALLRDSVSPRVQRLALRLCAHLVPRHGTPLLEKLAATLLARTGHWLLASDSAHDEKPAETPTAAEKDKEKEKEDKEMEKDKEREKEEEDEADEEGEKKTQWGVQLLAWSAGERKLLDVTRRTAPELLNAAATAANVTPEALAQKWLEELASSGVATLPPGVRDTCMRLSSALALAGGVVAVTRVTRASASGGDKASKGVNPNAALTAQWPLRWCDGHVAAALASEHLALVRTLLNLPSTSAFVARALLASVHTLPRALKGEASLAELRALFATLAVLGAFTEPVRVGATVWVDAASTSPSRGVVVDYAPDTDTKLDVVLHSSGLRTGSAAPSQTLTRVEVREVRALPAVPVDVTPLRTLAVDLTTALLAVLSVPAPSPALSSPESSTSAPVPSAEWITAELHARSLTALWHLAALPEARAVLAGQVPALLALAEQACVRDDVAALNAEHSLKWRRLWDAQSSPLAPLSAVSPLASLLPYYAHSARAHLLPTALRTTRLSGVVFHDSEHRVAEVVAVPPAAPTSAPRRPVGLFGSFTGVTSARQSGSGSHASEQMVLMQANAPMPVELDYYFEVTIEKADPGAQVAVGLCLESHTTWESGSYSYNSNKNKAWFARGARRQENYGQTFGAKSVIGCGWRHAERTVFFTKDGEDLGAAFSSVAMSEDARLVPAVSASKGVRVKLNFGQAPFRHAPRLVDEQALDAAERERLRAEAEKRRLEEAEKERLRRKQERAAEKAARREAAMPLTGMGYTLQQALKAMEATGYNGLEAAVNWLLENPDYNFADEAAPASDSEDEETAKDKGKEKDKDAKDKDKAATTAPAPPPPATTSDPEAELSAEARAQLDAAYKSNAAATYVLTNVYDFADPVTEARAEPEPSAVSPEWEQRVLPELKAFMERDGFTRMEVQDFQAQVRAALAQGNEDLAAQHVQQIMGDAIHELSAPLPVGAAAAKKRAQAQSSAGALRLERLQLGDAVCVKALEAREASVQGRRVWVPALAHVLGVRGSVQALDMRAKLVLVQFYDHERAALQQWWCPLAWLTAAPKSLVAPPLKSTRSQLAAACAQSAHAAAALSARRIVLALLAATPPPAAPALAAVSPLIAASHAVNEWLADTATALSDAPLCEHELASKLEPVRALLAAQSTPELVDACVRAWRRVRVSALAAQSVAVDASTAVQVQRLLELPRADTLALCVVFERGAQLAAKTTLALLTDSTCQSPTRVYASTCTLAPCVLPAARAYARIAPITSTQPKLKLTLVPVSVALPRARYLLELLLVRAELSAEHAAVLVDALLDALFACAAPSALKETLLAVLVQLLDAWASQRALLSVLPWARFKVLQSELTAQYELERRRAQDAQTPHVCSTYTQRLAEVTLCVVRAQTFLYGESSAESSTQNAIAAAALALARALHAASDAAPASEAASATEPSTAASVVTSTMPEVTMMDAPAAASEEKSGVDTGTWSAALSTAVRAHNACLGDGDEGDLEGDFMDEDDDMDEELRLALELSRQVAQPPPEPEPEGEPVRALSDAALPPPPSAGSTSSSAPTAAPQSDATSTAATKPAAPAPVALADLPAWLSTLVRAAELVEYVGRDGRVATVLAERIARNAWQRTREDKVEQRLVLLANLPTVPDAHHAAFLAWLVDACSAAVSIDATRAYLPRDKIKQRTLPWCVLELGERVATAAPRLTQTLSALKRKLPVAWGASSSRLNGATVHKFEELLRAQDERVRTWMRAQLYDDSTHEVTAPMKAVISELFAEFAHGGLEGVLDAEALDALQLACTGAPFGAESIAYALAHYDTAQHGDRRGLTLRGLLAMYTAQCDAEPLETWQELATLGYDLHLTRTAFRSEVAVLNALNALNASPDVRHVDEALVAYVHTLAQRVRVASPSALSVTQIGPLDEADAPAHRALVGVDVRVVRLRFEILRALNDAVSTSLPLLALGSASPLARRVVACRTLLFHEAKMRFLNTVLDATSVQAPAPTVTLNRLALASHARTSERASVLVAAASQLRRVEPRLFRQRRPPGSEPHFSLLVDFEGEHVAGEGGPYRQFFTDVARELRSGTLPLLVPAPSARDKLTIAPARQTRHDLRLFRCLGQLMGMAVRTGTLLTLDIVPFVWKPLVRESLREADVRALDDAFAALLRWVRTCAPEELEGTFTVRLSDGSTRELVPHGAAVPITAANRDQFASLALSARLNEAELQLRALRRGLCDVVPAAILDLCTWDDLQLRVCGLPHIDIALLRRHTEYSGVQPHAPHVLWFWQVLEEFSQEDRRAFVRFAWAQERLPSTDGEFERTGTRMMLKPYAAKPGAAVDDAFPKADTCFFNLMLPAYSSLEILRKRLLFAIHTDADSMNADQPDEERERNARRREDLNSSSVGARQRILDAFSWQ